MPIFASALSKATRTVAVDFQGETVMVDYRINVITPAFVAELGQVAEGESLAWQVSQVAAAWDVLGEDGQPVEPSVAFCKTLPSAFLSAVLSACIADMRPRDGEKKS